jgi:ATP-dependent DNA helicase RecG
MTASSSDILSLLAQGIGPGLHWFPEDVPLSRLAGTLVGMANSGGGTVLLGVSPRGGEVLGLQDAEAAVDRLFQAALMSEPPLVLPIPRRVPVSTPGGPAEVLWIAVPAGLPHVYSLDGRYLGREGGQTGPLPARRLRQLLVERGVLQFESRLPPEAGLPDLDSEAVMEYATSIGGLQSPSLDEAHEFLLRRGCLRHTEGKLHPTYAGLLLFGRYPQQWLPNATLLAGRFPGVTLADVFIKQELSGTLPEQLRQAEAFVRSNLRSVVRLAGLTHQELPEYPYEAVRELLVNAVAHRDYNLQGDNIHLYLFADRLEVHSPGGLPGPMNLENLLEARFSRNAVIAQVLSDLGFVERLGYGLNRVVTALRQAGLPPPRFEETAGTFRVTLYSAAVASLGEGLPPDLSVYQKLDINPRQQAALLYLAGHGRISSHQYQELCPEVHAETLRRDLADLVSRGLLIKIGDKKATYYILKRV